MNEIYDAIVAGAGPGGGAAAYFLSRAGWKVLVLEKEKLPRYKTCGGGISTEFLANTFPFSFAPVVETQVRTASYVIPGQPAVRMSLPEGAVGMVMRASFDYYLLGQGQAELRQGTAVKRVQEHAEGVVVETREGECLHSRYLVGADGANSVVARQLGLQRRHKMMAAIEVETPATPEALARFKEEALFVFGAIDNGYLWIFPKHDHLSVGIGAVRPRPGELQRRLGEVMREYGILLDGQPAHGHPIPLYSFLKQSRAPVATHRCLLVGDAAGLVDPLTGEGIRFAIQSGKLAAEALLAGQPEQYARRVDREIKASHGFGAGLARVFYRFPGACFALGVRNPAATGAFVDLLAGRAGYAEVIVRLVGSLPGFLIKRG